MSDDSAIVFVYGTLTDPSRVDQVLDKWRFDGAAVLEGCHRVEGAYPTVAPGGAVRGRLLVTSELEALDAYEAVASGLYVRVVAPVADDDDAWLYVGRPARLGVSVSWPGDGPFAARVRAYVADSVVVRRPAGGAGRRTADR